MYVLNNSEEGRKQASRKNMNFPSFKVFIYTFEIDINGLNCPEMLIRKIFFLLRGSPSY